MIAKFSRALGALLLFLTLAPAWADDYATVQRLQQAGQVRAALEQAENYIARHPNDPQMRFLRAGILDRSGRQDEALESLQELTREYPELAEPWNNLAVIHAARGDLQAAREALEQAVQIDPNYATALENLGDVQLRLAWRAYEQIRSSDDQATRVAGKIHALRAALADESGPPAAAVVPARARAPAPIPARRGKTRAGP